MYVLMYIYQNKNWEGVCVCGKQIKFTHDSFGSNDVQA